MKVKCSRCKSILEFKDFATHKLTKLCEQFSSISEPKPMLIYENNLKYYTITDQKVTARDLPTEIWSYIAEILQTSKQVKIIDPRVELWDLIDFQKLQLHYYANIKRLYNVNRSDFLKYFPNLFSFKLANNFTDEIIVEKSRDFLFIEPQKNIVKFNKNVEITHLKLNAQQWSEEIKIPEKIKILEIIGIITIDKVPSNIEQFFCKNISISDKNFSFGENIKIIRNNKIKIYNKKLSEKVGELYISFIPINLIDLKLLKIFVLNIDFVDFLTLPSSVEIFEFIGDFNTINLNDKITKLIIKIDEKNKYNKRMLFYGNFERIKIEDIDKKVKKAK